jgi:hypothetical protein
VDPSYPELGFKMFSDPGIRYWALASFPAIVTGPEATMNKNDFSTSGKH